MYKGSFWFSNQFKLIYLALLVISLIGFNLILDNALHLKTHLTGQQLIKQIYELQLNSPIDQKIMAALAQSKGFMLTPESPSLVFKNLIKPELEVFSYKTLSIGLYHLPTWIIESYLFFY